jgi:ABC-type transport system substrate-binding protein
MRQENNYWLRRMQSGRLSRRRFVGGATVLGAGAAGLALVGCGDDDSGGKTPSGGGSPAAGTSPAAGSPTAAAAQPQPGGVGRWSSSNATYDTFDAARSRFTPFATILGRTGQRIVQWNSFKDSKLGGGFAESWQQPDPQTVILKLRPNNFWQSKAPVNGRATKAEDMKFHIDRSKAGVLQDGTKDPNFYRNADYQVVDSVSVTDANTVTVKMAKPAPLFLNLLAQSYEVVQAPEAVKQFEKEYSAFNANQIIGTGPYVLTEFASEGRLKFKKFDKFAGKTYLDGVSEVPLFTDQAALQAAFEQKQVDVFSPATVAQLKDLQDRLKGKITDSPGFSANPIIGFQGFGGAPPWNNPNLMGAIFKAYDRRQLIQQFHGGRGAMSGNVPPTQGAFGIDEKELITFEGYREDRVKEEAEAKQMWAAGGGPALGDVTIDVPDLFEGVYQASSILVAMLNKSLGTSQFKAKVENYATITTKVGTGKYGGGNANLWYGWTTELQDPEPSSFLVGNHKSDQPNWQAYQFKVDGLDAILSKLAVELNPDSRKTMTKDAERLILKAWGAGFIYSHVQIVDTLYWNYLHASENAPFSTAHLIVNAWFDKTDPTYQGRPADPSL